MSFDARSILVLWLPAAAALLLAGCGAVRPTDAEQAARVPLYEQRASRLGPLDTWALQGRLAVSDDQEGGSGSLSWRQQAGSSRIDFHGALGRGAWRLRASAEGAELEFADGRSFRADSVHELVRSQVGWGVPVEPLGWWVRGLAAPGRFERRILDEKGRLSHLQQDGWTVEFGRYGEVGGESMPLKMTARQEDLTVKLAIKTWDLSSAHDQQH